MVRIVLVLIMFTAYARAQSPVSSAPTLLLTGPFTVGSSPTGTGAATVAPSLVGPFNSTVNGVTTKSLTGPFNYQSTLTNLQNSNWVWDIWAQTSPTYVDCDPSPCDGQTFAISFGQSPNLSGSSAMVTDSMTSVGDILTSNQVMGSNSPQIPDTAHTLVPNLHNFIYDVNVYVPSSASSALDEVELDITKYYNSTQWLWGTQCNVNQTGDKDIDIWNNVTSAWVSTGIACNMLTGAWNHVTIVAYQDANSNVVYKSYTLNGVQYPLNLTYANCSAATNCSTAPPADYFGVTLNNQIDGSSSLANISDNVDNMSLTYW